MKKLFILFAIASLGTGCNPTSQELDYSDYESQAGFNYMEDAIEAFDISTSDDTLEKSIDIQQFALTD